jgi:hypothetical protein
MSPLVQPFKSSHAAVLLAKTQPFAGSQLSVVQGLPSLQGVLSPALQVPALQVSLWVHASLSLHGPAAPRCTQPLAGWQLSAVHKLPSSQPTLTGPTHPPFLQPSPLVQASPSEQGKPLAALTQPSLVSQLSVVQGLLSSQSVA